MPSADRPKVNSAELVFNVGQLMKDLGEIKGELKAIREDLSEKYVTQKEFQLIRNIVFGAVGIILVGLMSAIVAWILSGGLKGGV